MGSVSIIFLSSWKLDWHLISGIAVLLKSFSAVFCEVFTKGLRLFGLSAKTTKGGMVEFLRSF